MTDDRLKTESAGRPWLKQGGSREVARRAGADGIGGEATPAGEASPNQLPHASPGLLPLGHYCSKKPASMHLEAGPKASGPLACEALSVARKAPAFRGASAVE